MALSAIFLFTKYGVFSWFLKKNPKLRDIDRVPHQDQAKIGDLDASRKRTK
jgi:hypothetical protein